MVTLGVFGAVWRLRPGAASLVAHILLNSFASPLLQLAKVSTVAQERCETGNTLHTVHAPTVFLRMLKAKCICA